MTPTSEIKDKAPQVEERPEQQRKRNQFSVIADSLNKIQERCGRTQKWSGPLARWSERTGKIL